MALTPEETLALLMDPLIRHPISRHSFAPSHTVAGAVCHGCGQRIAALRDHRCLLCGVAAHRRCLYALSEKCKTDASLKCTPDGSHIPPAEPPPGRLDATSSPAAVLNVAVKQPPGPALAVGDARRGHETARRRAAPAPAPVARLREAAARLSLSGLEAPRRPRWDPDDALPPEPAPAPAPGRPCRWPGDAGHGGSRASGRRRGASARSRTRAASCGSASLASPSAAWRRARAAGGAAAGPAGAALGAKAAQIVGAGLVLGSPAATGAVVGGALGIHAAATAAGRSARARKAAVDRAARTVGGATAEPFARRRPRARGARRGAVAAARLSEPAAATLRDVMGLDAQARALRTLRWKPTPRRRRCGRRSTICIKFGARTRGATRRRRRQVLRARRPSTWSAPAFRRRGRRRRADRRGHRRVGRGGDLYSRRSRRSCGGTGRGRDAGAGPGGARRRRRGRGAVRAAGAAALAKIGAGRDAHAKPRALVFCLEALGDSDEGPLVTADVLLPRAVACVAEAKVPHLRAELAHVDAFARDYGYWAPSGYALTTLRCALDVLGGRRRPGEQPVLDLGDEDARVRPPRVRARRRRRAGLLRAALALALVVVGCGAQLPCFVAFSKLGRRYLAAAAHA